jgi:hypothetical protein
MRQAIAEADQHASVSGRLGVVCFQAARSSFGAAESLQGARWQLSAIVLFRQAAVFAAHGLAQRRRITADPADAHACWDQVIELPQVRASVRPLSSSVRAQISGIIASGVSADHANLPSADLWDLRQIMRRVVRSAVDVLEEDIRAPFRLRAHRALRWIFIVLAAALPVGYGAHQLGPPSAPANLALKRAVSISSNYAPSLFPAASLVDGDKTALGCHSLEERNPWAVVDLGRKRTFARVVITNRVDGSTQRAVPLLIETSLDGNAYTEFARRDEVFETWTAQASPTTARYVRLTVLARSYLHLSEVEVYAE